MVFGGNWFLSLLFPSLLFYPFVVVAECCFRLSAYKRHYTHNQYGLFQCSSLLQFPSVHLLGLCKFCHRKCSNGIYAIFTHPVDAGWFHWFYNVLFSCFRYRFIYGLKLNVTPKCVAMALEKTRHLKRLRLSRLTYIVVMSSGQMQRKLILIAFVRQAQQPNAEERQTCKNKNKKQAWRWEWKELFGVRLANPYVVVIDFKM